MVRAIDAQDLLFTVGSSDSDKIFNEKYDFLSKICHGDSQKHSEIVVVRWKKSGIQKCRQQDV
jgi:hypothetical protein